MNPTILDELRRRWWLWVLVALSCLVLSACTVANRNVFYSAVYPRVLVLVLDKPTTGLDAIPVQQVFGGLLKAVENGERAVLTLKDLFVALAKEEEAE